MRCTRRRSWRMRSTARTCRSATARRSARASNGSSATRWRNTSCGSNSSRRSSTSTAAKADSGRIVVTRGMRGFSRGCTRKWSMLKLQLGGLLLMVCTSAGVAHAEWFDRTNDGIMGTRIVVELWSDDGLAANKAIDAVMAEMQRIDRDMSTYKPDSEVSRVNADAAKAPMVISPELFDLLST